MSLRGGTEGGFTKCWLLSQSAQNELPLVDASLYSNSLFVKANFSKFLGFIRELLQGRLEQVVFQSGFVMSSSYLHC